METSLHAGDATGMPDVGLKDLLQAGVHFGHQTHRWNPKMKKYIFAERSGIYIIDLKKTLRELERAKKLVRETILAGKNVLFVCTKPQLKSFVRMEAERCGAFFVTERWMGGMLTNFQTIKKNINRLKELERGVEEGAFEFYTKKERLLLERERLKLDRYLAGIKNMTRLPGLVFVVDAKREEIAIKEANRLKLPIVAIADTNADPDVITVPIAGNDDAIRSVSLITHVIAEAVESARREAPAMGVAAGGEQEVYTYSSDMGETGEGAPRRKRRKPRRRPKPDIIAQRLHATGSGAEAATDSGEGAAAPDEAANSGEGAAAPEASSDEGSPTVSGGDSEEAAVSPDTGGEDDRPGS